MLIIQYMHGSKISQLSLKTSKRYLQPPTLTHSGLLSSEDRTENKVQHMNDLSNVEEKQYASDSEQGQDKRQIRQVLAGISSKRYQLAEEPRSPLSPSQRQRSSVTPRLQDQEIIAVEEEDELDSNKGKQSVILQHIDFNNDLEEYQPEKLGSLSRSSKEGNSEVEHNYVIKCVEAVQPGWGAFENISETTPNDFSQIDTKFNKIRHSKNTCVQKLQSLGVQTLKVANRSCFTQNMAESQLDSINSPKSQQPEDINKILKKWNNGAYPKIETRNTTPNTLLKLGDRQRYLDEQIQKNVKHCISRYNSLGHNQNENGLLRSSNEYNENDEKSKSQSKSQFDDELLIKYQLITKRLETAEEECLKIESEKKQLLKEIEKKEFEIRRLNEDVREKDGTIEVWKDKLKKAEGNIQKWMEETKKKERKVHEFEKVMISQSEELRYFEEKNNKLEKELSKTIRYNDFNLQGSCQSAKKSTKLKKFDTFGEVSANPPDHKTCIEHIQALQEHIFDIEQKTIGVDIQVDKRVKIMSEHLDLNLRRSIHEQYEVAITSLKNQVVRLRQISKTLEEQNNSLLERMQFQERELGQREDKVRKMYEELVVEWRSIDKDKSRVKDNSQNISVYPPPFYNLNKSPSQFDINFDRADQNLRKSPLSFASSREQPTHYSSKDISLPSVSRKEKTPLRSFENRLTYYDNMNIRLSSPERSTRRIAIGSETEDSSALNTHYSFGKEVRKPRNQSYRHSQSQEENDIFSINSKIQKLREEINRQLDLIH